MADDRRELAARIAGAAAGSEARDFDRRSWLWMLLLGVALPVALIVAGWWLA